MQKIISKINEDNRQGKLEQKRSASNFSQRWQVRILVLRLKLIARKPMQKAWQMIFNIAKYLEEFQRQLDI